MLEPVGKVDVHGIGVNAFLVVVEGQGLEEVEYARIARRFFGDEFSCEPDTCGAHIRRIEIFDHLDRDLDPHEFLLVLMLYANRLKGRVYAPRCHKDAEQCDDVLYVPAKTLRGCW